MKKKKFTSANASSRRQQKDPLPWKYYLVTIFFAVLLAAGFFHAARLHFFSMELGASNHELRDRIDDLKAEARKLKLNKELAMSPSELKAAARELGLSRTTVLNLAPVGEALPTEVASLETEETAPPAPVKTYIKEEAPARPRPAESRPVQKAPNAAPKVVKTVKSEKAVPAAQRAEKKEDPTTSTRSRIIDTTVLR